MPQRKKSDNNRRIDNVPPPEGKQRWSRNGQPRIHGVAAFEWDVLKGSIWYSPEWEQIVRCEYDRERPYDQDWWIRHVHPEDMPMLERAFLSIRAGFADAVESVFRLQRGDGVWRRLLARSRVTEKSPQGAPLVVSGVCIDLSEAPLPGKTVFGSSVSDISYHSMLENSPDLFVRLSKNLRLVYANPAILRYLDIKEESGLSGATDLLKAPGGHMGVIRRNVRRVFEEKAVTRESISLKLHDGREVRGECSFWPEFDAEGQVQYAMVQFRDLTERHRMEQRALLNERRLEALYRLTGMESASEEEVLHFVLNSVLRLTSSKSGFIFIPEGEDLDKGLMLWSEDHYNHLPAHLLPDSHLPRDMISQLTDESGEPSLRAMNNGNGKTPLFTTFEGGMQVFRGIMAPVKEEERVVCIAAVCNKETNYDETDMLQLETFINGAWLIIRNRRYIRALKEAKESAEAANRAKNAFLANVSHELRTPLNGVLSMQQLIASMPLGSQQREYLITAQASGKALLRIISDLLDYSCMESGQMPLAMEVFDFRKSVNSTLSMFEAEARRKDLEFSFWLDPLIPRYLVGDEARVRQILFNLVGNAFKFTSQGEIRVFCKRLESPGEGPVGIELCVEDTGMGVPADKLEWIFDAFAQMANTHRGKHSGTGLGLSIVKHLTAMMRGAVYAQSEEGKGTKVVCSLFFDEPEEAPLVEPSLEKISSVQAGQQPLDILVVEDDAVGRLALSAFLQRDGHRVFAVEDGEQALEALSRYPFHCVFTDIAMPNMDGLELIRCIRDGEWTRGAMPAKQKDALLQFLAERKVPERHSSVVIPIVAVTAHSMIGDRERFLQHGADFYISKPIIRKELRERLARIRQRLQYKG